MKKFIVDRIEGDKAVLECENGDMVNLELKATAVMDNAMAKNNASSFFLL